MHFCKREASFKENDKHEKKDEKKEDDKKEDHHDKLERHNNLRYRNSKKNQSAWMRVNIFIYIKGHTSDQLKINSPLSGKLFLSTYTHLYIYI